MPEFIVDPHPPDDMLRALWRRAWGSEGPASFTSILTRSLVHVAAYDGSRLIGFVNVAWDGGVHAFLLDTCVDPDYRRRGIATDLVARATQTARARGAVWLHVDFEPHLENFYRDSGFADTRAGLIRLR